MTELSDQEKKQILEESTSRRPFVLDEALNLHTLLAVVHSPEVLLLSERRREDVVLARARKSFARAEKELRALVRQEIRIEHSTDRASKKMQKDWEARQEEAFGKGWRKIHRDTLKKGRGD